MQGQNSPLAAAMQTAEADFSTGSWAEPTAQGIVEAALASATSAEETLAALLQLARHYRLQHHLGKYKQSVDKAKRVLDSITQATAQQRAAWHLESGALAVATESFPKAKRELRLAYKLDPENEAIRCELYDYELVEGSFAAAVKLAPTFEDSKSYQALNLTAWRFVDEDELADRHFSRALDEARAQHGEGHAYTGHALLMLALLREEQRRRKEVGPHYEKAAAILRSQLKADHPWRELLDELGKRLRKYAPASKMKSPAQKIHQAWGRTLDQLRASGIEVTLGLPATEAQAQAVEKRLKLKLPGSYRDVLLRFAGDFATVGAGPGIGWDLAHLVASQKTYLAYVSGLKSKAERALWENRLCVVDPGGGDAVVVDLGSEDGAVYFFSCHADPELYGRRLAANFGDFVDRALALDCLTLGTPEYEQFLGKDGLDPHGGVAKANRRRVGMR